MLVFAPLTLAVALSAPAPALDGVALEAFVDGVVTTAMSEHHIAGVVVSVVHGGEVVLEKGYGYAREPQRLAADPRTSLFRIGSISKTFNALALMQLVERGEVDLDAEFTEYLRDIPFDLPHGIPSVRDLLTHSAGFEDGYLGHFWAIDEASDRTLVETVYNYQPAQVRPPGERVVYSKYGTAVIGLIIERIAGQPYADYMQENVFALLGMADSGFRDWNTPTGHRALAHTAEWEGTQFTTPDWAWMHAGWMPAGGVISTAHDMATWMLAQLGGGAGLVRPETLARMHQPVRANHSAVGASALGFWANRVWGHPTLEHDGAIFGFSSNMVLLPELGFGIFISTNSPSGHSLTRRLPERVVERLFGRESTVGRPNPNADLALYTGQYRGQRRGYTTIEKASQLLGSLEVSPNGQGYLLLRAGGPPTRWVPAGRDRFVNVETGERIAFSRDEDDTPSVLHGAYGHNNFERIGFFESVRFVIMVVALFLIAIVTRFVMLWRARKEVTKETPYEELPRYLTVASGPLFLLMAFALYKDMSGAFALTAPQMAHYPIGWAWVWIIAGFTFAMVTVLTAIGLFPVWYFQSWSRNRRIAYTAYVVIALTVVGLMHYWNLLGLRILG